MSINFRCWFAFLQHKSPDYSAVYIIFKTDGEASVEGHGLTFTLGRGNELGACPVRVTAVTNNTRPIAFKKTPIKLRFGGHQS